jgi:hypothetical protein
MTVIITDREEEGEMLRQSLLVLLALAMVVAGCASVREYPYDGRYSRGYSYQAGGDAL